MNYIKRHITLIIVFISCISILINLLFVFGKNSVAAVVYEFVLKRNVNPILPLISIDKTLSGLETGKILLKFEGFDLHGDAAKRLVPLIYFRSVYKYYPGLVSTGNPDLIINKGNEFIGKFIEPEESKLKEKSFKYVLTFKRDENGEISVEVRKLI